MRTTASNVEVTESGLAFSGVIDHQSIPNLISKLPAVNDIGPTIDLSDVAKIDSAGLAFLIHWGNNHLPDGQKLKLKGVSGQAHQLIAIMRLESVFELSSFD